VLELVGSLVAEELHRIASFEQRHALGRKALELDRADLRAVLLLLASPLRLLVVVELAFDSPGGAMEEVDRRPKEVFEVWLEARIAERRDERIENVGDRAADGGFIGERPRVWLVLKGTVAIELELGEDAVSGRLVVRWLEVGDVAVGRHGVAFCRIGRAHRGLRGDHTTAGGPGLHRGARRQRPERSGGRRGLAILARDVKRSRLGVLIAPARWGGFGRGGKLLSRLSINSESDYRPNSM